MSRSIFAALIAVSVVGTAAHAQERPSRFYVHAGPALLDLADAVELNAGGAPVPGAEITTEAQWTGAIEAGWFLTPNIAVSYTFGIPPEAEVVAAGTLTGLGTLGKAVYGPMAWTVHYHVTDMGRFQPYAGAGVTFLRVFDTKDGTVTNLEVGDKVGLVLQAGTDVMLDERWGLFVDVKKAYLTLPFSGNLGPAPVDGKLQIDPVVINAGLTYRF